MQHVDVELGVVLNLLVVELRHTSLIPVLARSCEANFPTFLKRGRSCECHVKAGHEEAGSEEKEYAKCAAPVTRRPHLPAKPHFELHAELRKLGAAS
jgi:hypothetical protein